jgi:hypothetical protein
LGIFNTTVDTGNRLHRLTWAYTQPALTGDNKLADGFVLYYQAADTATPDEHQLKLDIGSRALTFQWSLSAGSFVSYGIATYRNTAKGVEVGPLQQVSTWKRVAADQKVQSAGLEDLVTINPSAAGATALFVDNGGKVRLKTLTATPSKMVFENSSGAEQVEITGAPDPYLSLQPSADGVGQSYIGQFTKRWGDVLIISRDSIQLNVPSTGRISLDCNGGALHLNGLWHTSSYESLNASTTRAGRRIAVRDSNGSLLGYLQLYNA